MEFEAQFSTQVMLVVVDVLAEALDVFQVFSEVFTLLLVQAKCWSSSQQVLDWFLSSLQKSLMFLDLGEASGLISFIFKNLRHHSSRKATKRHQDEIVSFLGFPFSVFLLIVLDCVLILTQLLEGSKYNLVLFFDIFLLLCNLILRSWSFLNLESLEDLGLFSRVADHCHFLGLSEEFKQNVS